MSDAASPPLSPPAVWLQQGQELESSGRPAEALALYNQALAALRSAPSALPENRRLHALAWMNRGNALQQQLAPENIGEAVRAYDEAISLFRSLPLEQDPLARNHLGAAWLNRGHALVLANDASAIASFEEAIAQLEQLPLDSDPYFLLNLAGAWTNLANATLTSAPVRSHDAACRALDLLQPVERAHERFATMSLRARRAGVMAAGELVRGMPASANVRELVTQATDLVDEGLVLAREWEAHGSTQLRGLAARLFRLGAQLYAQHQPQFLAEYLLEHSAPEAFGGDAEFLAATHETLDRALADLRRPQVFVAGMPEADRQLAISASLRAAKAQLPALIPSPLPS
jgi:tetratricopeptide (TPR) repeat protein